MNKTTSLRRMAENEVVFRRRNHEMQRGFNELKQIAKEDGQERILNDLDMPLYFYCECSDENCRKRILVLPSKYDRIHKRDDMFIVKPGHEVESIERVIDDTPQFYIVQKYETPRPDVTELHPTSVNNA